MATSDKQARIVTATNQTFWWCAATALEARTWM